MRKKTALAALVAGSAMLVAASGAHADPPSAAGFTCGFTSTDDGGNGVLQPNEQFGEIDGGPYIVADLNNLTDNVGPGSPGEGEVADTSNGEIICSINVNSDSYAAAHAASASAEGIASLAGDGSVLDNTPAELALNSFVVYMPPTPISYIAAPGSNVYACTEWILEEGGQGGSDGIPPNPLPPALSTNNSDGETHLYYDYTPDPTDPTGQTSLGFTTDGTTAKCGLAISTG